jgi:hypothetical protein
MFVLEARIMSRMLNLLICIECCYLEIMHVESLDRLSNLV